MEIFKLWGSIFVDDKDAQKGLDGIDKKAESTGSKLGAMIGTAAKVGAGIVAGAGVAGAGLLALATKASDTASQINDMSVRTGLSTDRLQELKFAAEQSGVTFDSVQSAVARMTANMGQSNDAFEKLGVNTKDASGALLDTQTVFDQALTKLADMGNETERNALGMQIFGKGFTELSPLVDGGSASLAGMSAKAHELGLVMSEEAVSAGDQFGDSMDAMKATLGGMATSIGVELMPTFQTMMDWVMDHMPEIQAGIKTAFDVVGTAITTTVDTVKSLTQFFQEHWDIIQPILAGIAAGGLTFGIYTLAINAAAIATGIWSTVTGVATAVGGAFAAVLAFITSPIGLVVAAIALLVAAGVLLYKNWDTVKAFLSKTWDAIKQAAMTVFKAIGDFLSGIWTSIKGVLEKAWNGIKAYFSTLWKAITWIFENLTIVGLLIKHWDAIKGATEKVFNGIKTFISGVWDSIVSGIKGSINFILQAINSMIRGLNRIKVDVPAWVEKTTGMSDFGINIREIPLLAEGGNIVESGRVLVGEQGPEFLDLPRGARVTPLDDFGGGGFQTADITLNIDGDRLVNIMGHKLVSKVRVMTGLRV